MQEEVVEEPAFKIKDEMLVGDDNLEEQPDNEGLEDIGAGELLEQIDDFKMAADKKRILEYQQLLEENEEKD